jgi:hypothetical protein
MHPLRTPCPRLPSPRNDTLPIGHSWLQDGVDAGGHVLEVEATGRIPRAPDRSLDLTPEGHQLTPGLGRDVGASRLLMGHEPLHPLHVGPLEVATEGVDPVTSSKLPP